MAGARVGVGDAQGTDRFTAEHGDGVARLARGHPGEAPRRPGAQVARALRDHRQIRPQHVPGRQQPGVQGDGLQVTAPGLPDGDHPDQRGRQRVEGPREGAGSAPPSVMT